MGTALLMDQEHLQMDESSLRTLIADVEVVLRPEVCSSSDYWKSDTHKEDGSLYNANNSLERRC